MFGISGGSFGGSGVKKYAVVADLPLTGVRPGTLAHVEENLQGESALYLWSGTQLSGGWYKVATVNLAPSLSQGPDEAYALPNDGSPITLSLSAEDPEGLPITWSYQLSDGSLDGVAQVAQDGGTFTIAADPAAVAGKTHGAFSLTFVASDGVSLSAATSAFTLTFSVGPADPGSLTLEAVLDPIATFGVEFEYIISGEPGVLFALNTTDATLGGVYALDVSDPTSISLIGFYQPPGMALGISIGAAYSSGRLAFSAADKLVCVNVSDPSAMSEMFTKSGSDGIAGFAGDYILYAENPGGFRTLDMTGAIIGEITPFGYASNCKAPFQHPSNYEGGLFAVYTTDTVTGRRALLAEVSAAGAITISDPFPVDPAAPNLAYHIGLFDGQNLIFGVNASGEAARLFDVTDPANPVYHPIPEVTTGATANDGGLLRPWYNNAAVLDGFAYLGLASAAEQYRVFDVSDPASPSDLGLTSSADIPHDNIPRPMLAFDGGRLFAISDLDKTLRVLK